ncbi:MAG: phosphate-starvation-inducible PsiE family protein [Lachnospiraceae bacterium]|nr:phosphate-starvation-inducible PsiE family protein [Lachnospiraceae bacterium]
MGKHKSITRNTIMTTEPDITQMNPVKLIRRYLAGFCSLITTLVYLLIAGLLIFAVVIAAMDAINLLTVALEHNYSNETLIPAVQAILFIIVLATLIDLVRSYVKYGRVLLRPILAAGITTMVRKLLVASLTFVDIVGIVLVILALVAAVVFLGKEDRKIVEVSSGEDKDMPHLMLTHKISKRILDASPQEKEDSKK